MWDNVSTQIANLLLFIETWPMLIETGLIEHKIWLDALTAIGTFGATVIAVYLAIKAERASRREILSGLAIRGIDPNGNAYLTNTTREELRFSVFKNEDVIDHTIENPCYRQALEISKLRSSNWNLWKDAMVLSPEEQIPLHLKSLVLEDTFVALVAIKAVLDRRTRYWVFRFAGDKAKNSPQLTDVTHPHLTWVLDFSTVD